VENTTNQLFPILPDALLERLKTKYGYSYQKRIDENTSAVRFCTGWATRPEHVEELIHDIQM